MKREPAREPAVTMGFHSIKHYQDWLNQQTFNRGASMVLEMIAASDVEKLKTLTTHLNEALVAPEPDVAACHRALNFFFKFTGV